MTESVGAREARYAEALWERVNSDPERHSVLVPRATLRAMLDHDAEVAAAVSEAQAEVAAIQYERDVACTSIQMDRVAEKRRAESAEAEVERLLEGIRALADEWDQAANLRVTNESIWDARQADSYRSRAADLRDLLSRSPAATTGACSCGWGGVHDPDNPRCDANRPAPVSSGEAATDPVRGAVERLFPTDVVADLDRQRAAESARKANRPAPVSSGEAAPTCQDPECDEPAVPGLLIDLCQSHLDAYKAWVAAGRPTAPVVTPSAEGGE